MPTQMVLFFDKIIQPCGNLKIIEITKDFHKK